MDEKTCAVSHDGWFRPYEGRITNASYFNSTLQATYESGCHQIPHPNQSRYTRTQQIPSHICCHRAFSSHMVHRAMLIASCNRPPHHTVGGFHLNPRILQCNYFRFHMAETSRCSASYFH